MKLEVLDEVETELNEAIACYQEIESGLGIRLKKRSAAPSSGSARTPNHPTPAQRLPPGELEVFGYYIAYDIWADTIWILAIAPWAETPGATGLKEENIWSMR